MKFTIFVIIGIAIIAVAYGYTLTRKQEFKTKSEACQAECTAKGFDGYEYKLGGFKEGRCECINM